MQEVAQSSALMLKVRSVLESQGVAAGGYNKKAMHLD